MCAEIILLFVTHMRMANERIYFEGSSLIGLFEFHLGRDVETTLLLAVTLNHVDHITTLHS